MSFIPSSLLVAEFLSNASAGASSQTAEVWDELWNVALNGPLYGIVANMGSIIAVIALAFFMVQFAKNWLEGQQLIQVVQQAILPFVVVVLLANEGALLADLSRGLRDFINYFNNQVLLRVGGQGELDFIETLAQLADYNSILNEINTLRAQCDQFIDIEKMGACLDSVAETSSGIVDRFSTLHSDANDWVQSLRDRIELYRQNPLELIQGAPNNLAINPVGGLFNFDTDIVSGIARRAPDLVMFAIESFLIAFQIAFQYIVEMSMLLTALMGPIAIGSSLFPVGNKPFLGWITGFFTVGMVKLSYNIVVGFVAVAYSEVGPGTTLPITITVGLLAPILALLIATGGGFTIFSGLQNLAGQAISLGVRFQKKF